jgi:ATP-dependent Clp protease ATP-binding subunit ClpA
MEDENFTISELPDKSPLKDAGEDLTFEVYKKGFHEIYQRRELLDSIIEILCSRTKRNALLIGEPGVGKTYLVKSLAKLIVDGNVPDILKGFKIIKTSFNDILSSAKGGDDWGWKAYISKLKDVLRECSEKKVILFMDEIHTMFGFPQSSNFIKPYLSEGKLIIIGATTPSEYMRYLERETALIRRFQILEIPEPPKADVEAIIRNKAKEDGINISDDLINLVLKYSEEYIPYRFQPDKSLDILEQLETNLLKKKKNVVERIDIEEVISKMTGVPSNLIGKEKEKMIGLEVSLNNDIIGQEDSIKKICRRLLITRNKIQINRNRPLGVFLISGPSGVGKTEFAKSLAKHFTGSEKNLINIDMTIYKSVISLETLLGTYTPSGQEADVPYLTKQLKTHPLSVLLLDEIDKANPEVLTIFMQALDEGKMSDYQGNEIYFNNVVVLMTCNIGFTGEKVIGIAEETKEMIKERAMRALRNYFPKEFLGRFDEVLVFNPLSEEMIDRFINQKINKLMENIGKRIEVSEQVFDLIRKTGFDKEYGARRLNKAIDDILGFALVELKLKEDWDNIESVKIDFDEKGKIIAQAVLN